jgi:hypothetical protein
MYRSGMLFSPLFRIRQGPCKLLPKRVDVEDIIFTRKFFFRREHHFSTQPSLPRWQQASPHRLAKP